MLAAAAHKVLVLGAQGQLGRALYHYLAKLGFQVVGLDRQQVDITDELQVAALFRAEQPWLVLNAAGSGRAVANEALSSAEVRANQQGPQVLAQAAASAGVILFHISCAWVFDGLQQKPYKEDDLIRPVGLLGESKWLGEEQVRRFAPRHIILRTHWLFSLAEEGWLAQVLEQARQVSSLQAVADHIGQPTPVEDVARVVGAMLQQLRCQAELWGTFHYASAEYTSSYGFCEAVLALARQYEPLTCEVLEARKAEEVDAWPARPNQSRLDCRKLRHVYGIGQRPWRNYLATMLAEYYRKR